MNTANNAAAETYPREINGVLTFAAHLPGPARFAIGEAVSLFLNEAEGALEGTVILAGSRVMQIELSCGTGAIVTLKAFKTDWLWDGGEAGFFAAQIDRIDSF